MKAVIGNYKLKLRLARYLHHCTRVAYLYPSRSEVGGTVISWAASHIIPSSYRAFPRQYLARSAAFSWLEAISLVGIGGPAALVRALPGCSEHRYLCRELVVAITELHLDFAQLCGHYEIFDKFAENIIWQRNRKDM